MGADSGQDAPASVPGASVASAEAASKDVGMTSAEAPAPPTISEDSEAVDSKWFQDPSFVTDLLGALPGVDINDPRIQEALKEVGGSDDKKEGDGGASSGADSSGNDA